MSYLETHPNGKHRDTVNQFISDMSEEYYVYLKKNIALCQEQEDWGRCIRLCGSYSDAYGDDKRSKELQRMQRVFRKKLQDKIVFANLIQNAKEAGTDYKGARRIFLDYLEAHPDSSLKKAVQRELTVLEGLEKQQRRQQIKDKITVLLNQTEGRFVEKEENIISDTRTGLMWAMMDSKLDLDKCLNYESAQKYVNDLRTGDYSDWRVPSTKELAKIYKNEPFFPSWGEKWFWTSNNYKRYSDGWRIKVDIVTSDKETSWRSEQADAFDCGTVHAVRP
jgi:hypothetical protein